MKLVVVCCLRVDEDPPPVLRIACDELEPLVFSAPGIPDPDRPVDALTPASRETFLLPLTFLIELFKFPVP